MEDVVDDRGRDWFVGVDWASQTHHVFVIDAQGRKLGERVDGHGGVANVVHGGQRRRDPGVMESELERQRGR